MSSQESVQYDEEEGAVRISDLEITDPELVEFFEGRDTEAELLRALRVGVLALEVAESSRDVEYVERAVAELRHDFESHIDGFVDDIEDQLEENSALIEDGLDPRSDGTPTNRLKEDLEAELEGVREKISKEMGRLQEFERSTHKGEEFEARVGELISESGIGPFDEVEHTGEREGVLEDNKKGDFVIRTEEGYTIVIEAKDWTGGLSKNKIQSELDEAVRNREADAGLLVSRNASASPETHIGWFHEFDPQRSFVALGQDPDDEIHPAFFKFAYNWARIRAQQAQTELASGVDEGWVASKLERLKEDVDDLQSMRDQAKNIQGAAEELESELHDKEAELLETISDIRREVATA